MSAQVPEKLIFNGEETSMAFCPPLPKSHPQLVPALEDDETNNPIVFSTACWRGYIGSWEIRDGQFYLVDIKGSYRMIDKTPILADWFTGVIRIPQGKCLHYVHMGFGSVYEQEIHVKIENGRVVNSRVIDNRNKEFDTHELGWRNLPGFENCFEGNDEL